MLTLAKVSDGGAATSYYEGADDYYSENQRAPSKWSGRGADLAGQSGWVDSAEFRKLLDGQMPDGTTMHRGGEESRRAATDLTFSAPKSISMQALIGGDHRLIAAHEAATARALAYIEENLAAYRITTAGVTRTVVSGNLLVAQFRHDLSRSADPQIHTHAVVLNTTQRTDGQWRALDAAPLYAQQKLLGAIYRAELAREVRALGYGVRLTNPDGRFELAHINDVQVAAFSSRSSAIEAALAVMGKDREGASAREREVAALSSRLAKHSVDRGQLMETWREKSLAVGVNYSAEALPLMTDERRRDIIERAMTFAVEHLTERESVVSHPQLVTVALGRATGIATLPDIEAALAARVASGSVIEQEGRYTTQQAQETERAILYVENRGRGAMAPIVRQHWLSGTEGNRLNAGQREAARLILTTTDRVVGIQGRAGTGKTTMLGQVREVSITEGWKCVGLAPSAAAAQELGKAGIESKTIAAFLARNGAGIDNKSLVIVDESGMVSARDMRAMLEAIEFAGARAVLVGDTRQLKAVQAGMPFFQLQANGMATANMKDIQRQTNRRLREAVELAADGTVGKSLSLLAHRIAEISHGTERHAAIAKHYSKLDLGEREGTLVIAGTNRAREVINELIRSRLGFRGAGVKVRILVSKDLTEAQRKSSISYQAGDVVQVLRNYESLGMRTGESATVLSAGGGRVQLRRQDGETVEWRPVMMPNVAAFQLSEREVAVGEKVRITANNYAKGLINGESVRVSAVGAEKGTLSLTKIDGKSVSLDLDQPLHIEHGYCSTVHSAQGQTCQRVIIDAEAKSAMANESIYYVAISRAREEVNIYTDDRALLPAAMSRGADKTMALSIEPDGGATRAAVSKGMAR